MLGYFAYRDNSFTIMFYVFRLLATFFTYYIGILDKPDLKNAVSLQFMQTFKLGKHW